MLERSLPWPGGERKAGGLTNNATTQVQNEAFPKFTSSGGGEGLQDLHYTGQQWDVQKESL